MNLRVRFYQREDYDRWNAFVMASRNGTFLFHRDYMDYHADRFTDASLVLTTTNDEWLAILPASRHDREVRSHGGLTYGGFVVGDAMTAPRMLESFDAVRTYLAAESVQTLLYKTIPSIYHRYPTEEDRYALFRCDARRIRAEVLTVAVPRRILAMQERRCRAIKKAAKQGVTFVVGPIPAAFWEMLTAVLGLRHSTSPTHTFEEIKLLESRFPTQIVFCGAELGGRLLAGVVMYETPQVAHAQYICASDEGRDVGALDYLFERLLVDRYRNIPHFDFGNSNEQGGRILNAGLVDQKEGFGARTIVHDFYEVSINQ